MSDKFFEIRGVNFARTCTGCSSVTTPNCPLPACQSSTTLCDTPQPPVVTLASADHSQIVQCEDVCVFPTSATLSTLHCTTK